MCHFSHPLTVAVEASGDSYVVILFYRRTVGSLCDLWFWLCAAERKVVFIRLNSCLRWRKL